MVTKRSTSEKVFDGFNILFLTLLVFIFAYPLIYVVFASLSDPNELIKHQGLLLMPKGFSLEGYKLVLNARYIHTGYLNTIFYVVAGTAINIFMSCLGAYVLSRKKLYIRRFLTVMVVFTMYFSGGLIPLYLTVRNLGLYNSRLALLLPVAINTWNLIVMRTSFSQVPESLEEAAKIDGANDFVILFRVYIPVVKANIAVMVLFYAVQHWNSWFNAMIYLADRGKYPLQLFLRELLLFSSMMDLGTSSMGDGYFNPLTYNLIKYCAIVVSTLPILCIYPFLQKHFTKGVMIGSVKE